MSEHVHTETWWICNGCGHSAREGSSIAARWHRTQDHHGVSFHACPRADCAARLAEFCRSNGVPLPASLAIDPCLATPDPEDEPC